MNENPNRILILALGNYIMGDDAVGLEAANELKKEFGSSVDIFEVSSAGLSLMDLMEGYSRVLILDSVPCTSEACDTIKELTKDDLSRQYSYSPHYTGLPEIIKLANRLGNRFPYEIKALTVEIREKGVIREGLSEETKKKLEVLIEKASELIRIWLVDEIFIKWQDEIDSP